jgi:HK97 gp10 family phage protein
MSRAAVTLPAYRKTSIEGIQEIRARIAAIIDHLSPEHIKDICMEAGTILYDELRATVPGPSKGNEAFPAGTLRDGVFIGRGDPRKPNIQVGISNKPSLGKQGAATLAGWLEYGTVKMEPEPFFRPAVASTKPEMAFIIGDGLQHILEEETV